jgi:importin subunit beta-1
VPYIPQVITVIEHIALDADHTDSNTAACCGLLGDLLTTFGARVSSYMNRPSIQQLLQEGKRSQLSKTKKMATWALKELRKVAA